MQQVWHRLGRVGMIALLFGVAVVPFTSVRADDIQQTTIRSTDKAWQQTVDLVGSGDFSGATKTIKEITNSAALTDKVRTWLEEYETKQAARHELDRADFEKYVGYAKQRVERKEYGLALGWTLAASNCTPEREAFLGTPWIQDLVNDSLASADAMRKAGEWQDAWHIYYQLGRLFEREPRYRKLTREAVTHLRLDSMFKKERFWKEQIEKVTWRDGKKALELIELYYVEAPDFKAIAQSGLEQILLLAESKSAQEAKGLEGLASEPDRVEFETRVQERLDQIKSAASLDRTDCIRHFRRVVRDINPETINLPESLVVAELVRGALDPLDDFTTIIWPKNAEEFDKHTRGNFVGVGISIIKNVKDEVEVVSPIEDSSAYRAGIQAGDIITEVNGKSLEGLSLSKVVDTITGPENTEVTLTVRREKELLEFPLERKLVKIRSVKGIKRDARHEERWNHWLDKDMGIGYVRVTSFQRNTVEDMDNVLSDLPNIKALVLDLRGNPGGLLDSAWQLTSRFLKRGDVVVSTKARIPSENQTFDLQTTGSYSELPLVVLVDDRSASASEIVSGAIRDNGRGMVVGERTFGKFSVQNLIPLSRSGAKLKVTTARYYLPGGDSLHREPTSVTWGVEPDVAVSLVNKEQANVYRLWREANLLGPARPKRKSVDDDDKDGDVEITVDGDGDADAEEEPTKVADSDSGKGESKKPAWNADEVIEWAGVKYKRSELPKLEQPDENDRPKEDPQLDTALLLLRVALLGEKYPTVATANTETEKKTAQP